MLLSRFRIVKTSVCPCCCSPQNMTSTAWHNYLRLQRYTPTHTRTHMHQLQLSHIAAILSAVTFTLPKHITTVTSYRIHQRTTHIHKHMRAKFMRSEVGRQRIPHYHRARVWALSPYTKHFYPDRFMQNSCVHTSFLVPDAAFIHTHTLPAAWLENVSGRTSMVAVCVCV